MSPVAQVIWFILMGFLLLLIARLVMEYVFLFARSYEPKGAVVVVLEVVYSITDPPLKFLRRFIPPLRLGGVSLDLSFLVLFVIVTIGLQVASSL
ncbi:YggT family protein [Sporichthya sp.]|uniref:YggT family protein n=1 Tax=Sporichthya sp. TaxID=65475 RepID=UPI001851F337|nr:YggT family protein [Sporichthya sp.]MBA3744421.1 YggT family protein [Sporichthya sp.]